MVLSPTGNGVFAHAR